MLKDKKTLIYGAILAILLIVAYFVMFAGGGEGDVVTVASEDPTSAVSEDLLKTLNSLNVIKLDETLFADPSFVSLSDFGVIIPAQPIGRRNPFAPL
jgi:hypothetical protein